MKTIEIEIEVISGVEGPCLAIECTRVAGPKPWGGGRTIQHFDVSVSELLRALPFLQLKDEPAEAEPPKEGDE